MTAPISRRRFLTQITAAGGATLLGAAEGRAAKSRHRPANGKGTLVPKTDRPTLADLQRNVARQEGYDAVSRRPVYNFSIDPHWMPDNTRFWYRRDGPNGQVEFLMVDAVQGSRLPAFDHAKLAAELADASGQPAKADTLPLNSIRFTSDEKAIEFLAEGKSWKCDLTTYVCTRLPDGALDSKPDSTPPVPDNPDKGPHDPNGSLRSPDGKWTAFLKDHNLWVRPSGGGGETQISKTGTAELSFGEMQWSPDSRFLAAYRIDAVQPKEVYMVESSPKEGWRGVLHSHPYAQPGDKNTSYEPWVFAPSTGTATPVQAERIDFGDAPERHWSLDGTRFLYEKTDRGHQRFRIFSVDSRTGAARTILDERTKTFINTSHSYTYYPKGAEEIIYVSEQDGWRHLYLYDGVRGGLKTQITQGEWVVRDVLDVDENKRQIRFAASGKNPGEDPYLIHQYRVNFDGTGLVALTDGNGDHSVQFSPDHTFLIDTYSRADLPPVHTLRRVADGGLVCPLEKADISELTAHGWPMPEVFHAKGRDGRTDIWGLVFRPTHLDPNKRYPVIENIYAGPQDSFVRKRFAVRDAMQALAELGFVVVQSDGMGTRNRSKAFHDVCWRNLKDAGLPDRIAWIKALAKKSPSVDTSRVGIYGTSAGGQNSTGALLLHPDFYKVGVSSCGCHDNRIDKQWWNEQWMGYPVGPWYGESSNLTLAPNLRGKLLLMVGELDTNVPPESTLRLTNELIKAGKDYDLLVLPGMDHTGGGAYGDRRRQDYFIRHLLGIEPPDRNVPSPPKPPITLHSRPVSEERSLAGGGGEETSILFQNKTEEQVELFWLPGDGTRKSYGILKPGDSRDMHTFAGHAWLVVSPSGRALALFVGEPRTGIAEISPEGK